MNYMYINYKPIHYYTVLDKKLKLALVYLKIDILKFYTLVNNAQSVNFSVPPPPPINKPYPTRNSIVKTCLNCENMSSDRKFKTKAF